MEKIGARFICIDEPEFMELIDRLYARLKGKDKETWISPETAMSMLNITSPTSLQKYRDEGEIRISQVSKKTILYDRKSIEEFIERKARKSSWR